MQLFNRHLYFEDFSYQLRRWLLGEASISAVCEGSQEISPAEIVANVPAVFLPAHLEHIVGDHPEGVWADQMARLEGGEQIEPATIVYELKNVALRAPSLIKGAWRERFPMTRSFESGIRTAPDGKPRSLVSGYYGVKYFGHWLRDDVSKYYLAEDYGKPLSIRTADWTDKPLYTELFEQTWAACDFGDIETLFVFSDDGLNASRRERTQLMRAAVSKRFTPRTDDAIVYLRRRGGGLNPRFITNEAELVSALERRGVEIVDLDPAGSTAAIAAMSGAQMMMTVEGSQQNHGLMALSSSGAVLSILAPDMFNTMIKPHFNAAGIKYGFVVGEADGAGFRVNIRDLMVVMDRLLEAL